MLYSFDVFDTVLTRNAGDPTSIFFFVGEEARRRELISISSIAFRETRILAEKMARAVALNAEPTLEEIYSVFGSLLGFADSKSSILQKLEMKIEEEFIVPVPGVMDRVEFARQKCGNIVFISDMYLPSDFIESQLRNYGILREGDRVYVSNQYRASKREGTLFLTLLKEKRINPEALLHEGNDLVSDYKVPKRLGIQAKLFTAGNLNRFEKLLETHSSLNDFGPSLLAGASRLSRLEFQKLSGREKTLADIVCSVVGPVLTCFVAWILHAATEKGIQRLYFLSRDGYLLKKIAEKLQAPHGNGIDLRYLYGSRQAWHLAGVSKLTDTDMPWVLDRTDNVTLMSVLTRIDLRPEEIEYSLSARGWIQESWQKPLKKSDWGGLWEMLCQDEEISRLISAKAAVRRKLVQSYLVQEGLTQKVPWAIVDLGWHGRVELSLRRLLHEFSVAPSASFYIGMNQGAIPEIAQQASTFLFGGSKPPCDIPFAQELLETFCAAPHGSVVGYAASGDCIMPTFRNSQVEELNHWGFRTVEMAVVDFASKFSDISAHQSFTPMQQLVAAMLNEFSTNPTLEEALVWGNFPYEDGQIGDGRSNLFKRPEVTMRNCIHAVYYGNLQLLHGKRQRVLWRGGLNAIADNLDWPLNICLAIGRFNAKLFRLIRYFVHRMRMLGQIISLSAKTE